MIPHDQLFEPSFASGFADCQELSAYPGLWDDMVIGTAPALGVSDKIIDFSGNRFHGELAKYWYVGTRSSIWNVDKGQTSFEHKSTNNEDYFHGSGGKLPLQNSTVILWYEKTDTTLRNSSAFTPNLGNHHTTKFIASIPDLDGSVYWKFGNKAASYYVELVKSGLTFGDDVWGFTTGPRGMEIWQNGNLEASNSLHPIRNPLGPEDRLQWGTESTTDGPSDLAKYKVFIVYNRQLTEQELAVFAKDPLAPFRLRELLATGDSSTNFLRNASHSLGITDSVVSAGLFNKSAENTLSLSDVASPVQDRNLATSSVLSLSDTASILSRSLFNPMVLSQEVVDFLAIDDFKPVADTLNFTQTVINTGNIQEVEHELEFTDTAEQTGLMQDSAAQNLGITDSAIFTIGVPWVPVEVDHDLGLTHWATGIPPQSITQTLGITDEAFRPYQVFNEITFQQTPEHGKGHEASNLLEIQQSFVTENLFYQNPTHDDFLTQSVAYYIDSPCGQKNYMSFEGSGDTDTIDSAPMTWESSFSLESMTGEVLYLRSPETDDTYRIGYQRINRETQGGEINVFADPNWVTNQTLLFTIVALSDGKNACPDKIGALLDFFQTYLGQEILLHDWEGITWRGVITTPNETAVEDGESWWTMSFEFEGVPTSGASVVQSLQFTDQLAVQGDFNRAVTQDLGLDHTIGLAGVITASVGNTMNLNQPQAAYQEEYILRDTFSGSSGDVLNNKWPTEGSARWWAHTNYKADGSQSPINSGAYMPFLPVSGRIYYIEWNARSLSPSSGYETLFFLGEGLSSGSEDAGSGAYGAFDPTTLKAGFVLREGEGGQVNACRMGDAGDGNVDTSEMSDPTLRGVNDNIDLRLVLDTSEGSGDWTVTWYAKSIISSVWTEVRSETGLLNEDITMVGWSNDNASTSVDLDGISILERISA